VLIAERLHHPVPFPRITASGNFSAQTGINQNSPGASINYTSEYSIRAAFSTGVRTNKTWRVFAQRSRDCRRLNCPRIAFLIPKVYLNMSQCEKCHARGMRRLRTQSSLMGCRKYLPQCPGSVSILSVFNARGCCALSFCLSTALFTAQSAPSLLSG